MSTVRLLAYNLRSMRDDRTALARVIGGLRPDIVCAQEAPRLLRWRRGRRWLAEATGLAPVLLERPAGLELYAGPRAAVLHREHHLLSPVPGMHRRGLVLGEFEVAGARLVVACVHLDIADVPRRRHAAEVVELLERRFAAPVVVAGDINEEPGGATWEYLCGRLRDAWAIAPSGEEYTHSAADPVRRIDGVFADRRIEVIGCGVPDAPELLAAYPAASDHRPVLAELRVRANRARRAE
jgi:endonuclease/exonuclease/phosphatase family metal-dependent hydrolase